MKVTSSQAAKMLRRLVDERNSLASAESRSSSFNAAVGEDIETVRPEYDYAATQKAIADVDAKIRKLKHAINLFNVRQDVPGFDMTIDQMLVYLPQLCRQRDKLDEMRSVLPKTRAERSVRATSINIIDYTYANYDVAEAEKDYNAISDMLAKAQTALDTVNTTVEFDIEI